MSGNIYSTIRNFGHQLEREREQAERDQFGRDYIYKSMLGGVMLSDLVSVPGGARAYKAAAITMEGVSVQIDYTGELAGRAEPTEGTAYAVVQTTQDSPYWDRLDQLIPPNAHPSAPVSDAL
jgi:hypothetical protein